MNEAGTAIQEAAVVGEVTRDALAGTRLFQRFTLEKILGGSAKATVWLAHDDRLQHLVALKLVPDRTFSDASAIENLKRATQQGQGLSHPNIARIFDFIEDADAAAISMEYVDGLTLSNLRLQKRAKCYAVGELAPWVTSLCDALAYAHDSASAIHGDLNPGNLMVNSRMELKITDFSIARLPRDPIFPHHPSSAEGTLTYLSPQQIPGEDPSPADDIYALGATLYELLSSRPPFYGDDLATQVRENIAPWIGERREQLGIAGEAVPRHWEETIAACLAKNPAARPQSAVEIARRLRLGGTIRLAAAQQESKVRGLVQSLSHARLVGAAAGVAALIAAAILAIRAANPNLTEVARAAEAALPDAYAMEMLRPNTSPSVTILASSPPRPSGSVVASAADIIPAPPIATLRLATTPAGATFAIYLGAIAGDTTSVEPVQTGVAPDSVSDLSPGRYTIVFNSEGWPEERTEVALEAGTTTPLDYSFRHGTIIVRSTPAGAEIFVGTRSLGHTPCTVELPPGKQELTARFPERLERKQSVTIEDGAVVTAAFEMRATPSRSTSRIKKAPQSTLSKFGQSLKNAFTRKPATPAPKRKP